MRAMYGLPAILLAWLAGGGVFGQQAPEVSYFRGHPAHHRSSSLMGLLLVTVGEFGRSPRLGVSTSGNTNSPDGRDHWPYCYTALVAGAGMSLGRVFGASDQTASSPKDKPVHPNDLFDNCRL